MIPFNSKTTAQETIRGYFTAAVTAYQAEDQAIRDAWDDAIKGKGSALTGFNYYLGLYIKYLIDWRAPRKL